MCNLYSMTKNQAAIRDLFKVGRDTAGNLPPLPAIFPDQMAPIVRINDGERELIMMRWGMPNPPQFPGITTNIRNTIRRTGADGSGLKAGASCRCHRSASMRGRSRPKHQSGSPSTRPDRSSLSPESGPNGMAFAAPKQIPSRDAIGSMAF
jgi:hypothetical protein